MTAQFVSTNQLIEVVPPLWVSDAALNLRGTDSKMTANLTPSTNPSLPVQIGVIVASVLCPNT